MKEVRVTDMVQLRRTGFSLLVSKTEYGMPHRLRRNVKFNSIRESHISKIYLTCRVLLYGAS